MKAVIVSLSIMISMLMAPATGIAATYYLATPAGGPGGSGTLADPWHDLNYALNKYANNGTDARVKPGDTLYLRGGVYNIAAMTTPIGYQGPVIAVNTNATSATITISSYPGEWAILDGGGTKQILNAPFQIYNIVFQNMEIRKGYGKEGCGFAMGAGPAPVTIHNGVFRNLYFHDNTNTDYNSNPNGLSLAGENCIVEYCTFANNGAPGITHLNSSNLQLYNCYDISPDYPAGTIDAYPRKNNVIRYNLFIGSSVGIKDKGDSNFVDNTDPTNRHPEWANEIHHNVFANSMVAGYYLQQDFVKVHHNLFLSTNNGVLYDGQQNSSNKVMWEAMVYNNTFLNTTNNAIKFNYSLATGKGYNAQIYNNLILGTRTTPLNFFGGQANTWPMIEDHNGFDMTSSIIGVYANQGTQTLNQWKALGFATGGIQATLSLLSDYSLFLGSPAIGAGRAGEDLGAIPFGTTSWYWEAGAKPTNIVTNVRVLSITH